MEYLIECSRSAREELLLRVAIRDSYLKLHFLIQAVLLAMSKGVKMAGVETSGPLALSLYLAVPLTAVVALLYYTEDRLIGQLSSYIGGLSQFARDKSSPEMKCWDVSPQLREYARTTVWYRFFAQLAAFVITPSVLVWLLYGSTPPASPLQWGYCTSQVVVVVAVLVVSIREFRYRMKTGQPWIGQAEAGATPKAGCATAVDKEEQSPSGNKRSEQKNKVGNTQPG